MKVPLTSADFLDRAAAVYRTRIGVVDEPGAPDSLGDVTYGEIARRVRALQAGLDELGVEPGDRVAVVSPNSARMLELLYAVPSCGRILVPINFRLRSEEVRYIVEHSGASVLLVDPEVDEPLATVSAKHRILLGAQSDDALLRFESRAASRGPASTRTPPRRSTTPAGPPPGPRVSRSPTATSG